MSSSNRKPATPKEAPTEPFKRSVASCMRAFARRPELEVSFASDRPSLVDERARLPEPPRKMTGKDASILRGYSDAMALRLACHDTSLHRKLAPQGDEAKAVFDAVEQARVEALGSRRMEGVAGNIGAMLEDKYHRSNFNDITERADAPLADALAMMVRERLTGLAPPPAVRNVVELWREWIEEKAGKDLDRMGDAVENQQQFARTIRELLSSLDMAEESSIDPEDSEDDDDESQNDDSQDGEDGESADESASDRDQVERSEDTSDQLEEGMQDAPDGPTGDMPEEMDEGEGDESSEPWRPPSTNNNTKRHKPTAKKRLTPGGLAENGSPQHNSTKRKTRLVSAGNAPTTAPKHTN